MSGTSWHSNGPGSLVSGLEDLLIAAQRSVAAYRLAERVVDDHRVQAALARLRLDHERHVEELNELRDEALGDAVIVTGVVDVENPDPAVLGPVAAAVLQGNVNGATVLEAIRTAEADMHRLYDDHVNRNYMEPVRAALARHRREEEAHLAFLNESGLWQPPGAEGANSDQQETRSTSPPPIPAD
ncbi:MAG TPA: hypothetical protein VNZ57_02045 [Longimicrobiales bacterium]|nr:hypothetical protein [Longimicrobiales bacterium]